jgi:hypothetical protein
MPKLTLKQKILALKERGFSYDKISEKLKCSKATVAVYVNNTSAKKKKEYRSKKRKTNSALIKEIRGGKCESCGFDKCMGALHFHHVDASKKSFSISTRRHSSMKNLLEEAKKCVLVCSNCHTMIHEGLIPCPKRKKSVCKLPERPGL